MKQELSPPLTGKKLRLLSNLPKVPEDEEPFATPMGKGVPLVATRTANPTTGRCQVHPGAGTRRNALAGLWLLRHIYALSAELVNQPRTGTADATQGSGVGLISAVKLCDTMKPESLSGC